MTEPIAVWHADHVHFGWLLDVLEKQVASGRPMNQSLYAVRLWLRGEGVATR